MPARIVAVSRVRNEDDIVEAFVRHHAGLVDWIILLDNGSTDNTASILRSLKSEGAPISVYRAESTAFAEEYHNTFLFRQAVSLAADWVLCLDCDEFVDVRRIHLPLRSYLAKIPFGIDYLELALVGYHGTANDDESEIVVPRRIGYRSAVSNVPKVVVRASLAVRGATIAAGNHAVLLSDQSLRLARTPDLVLAHYPMRSGWQMLAKALVGRLKVLALGSDEERNNTADHYAELLANLQDHPEWLLDDREFLDARRPAEFVPGGVVYDPIDYAGDPLRYTIRRDYRLHAARSIIAYCEQLARQHGALLERTPPEPGIEPRSGGTPYQVL